MQREAVQAIQAKGGAATAGRDPFGGIHAPEWLRNVLGDEWFRQVFLVSLGSSSTDKDLEYLKQFPEVQTVNVNCTAITDAGLERVRELTELTELGQAGRRLPMPDWIASGV